MENRDKEPKGSAATASKMAASKKQSGNEASPAGKNMGQNQGEQDLLQQAKQTTNEVVNQVQQQASSQVDRQKETAAAQLTSVVTAVRRFGESLNQEGDGPIARYASQYGDKAAQSLERVANYIRDTDSRQLLNDAQSFGRRRPELVVCGGLLLGFVSARLIKSSLEAGTRSSMNNGARGAMNTRALGSMNMGGQQPNMGAQQPYNTDVSTARPPAAPNVP